MIEFEASHALYSMHTLSALMCEFPGRHLSLLGFLGGPRKLSAVLGGPREVLGTSQEDLFLSKILPNDSKSSRTKQVMVSWHLS